jgi:polyketide biosynthesis enoyl-CoA hydratase PksH
MELSVINELNNYVSRIILNQPQTGNVVNDDNLGLIYRYIEQSIKDTNCRIIIIEGKAKVFCRGMDFNNLLKNSNSEIKAEFSEPYKKVIKIIRNSPKPVIAKIDGDVLAGGMGIMLACDILIATKNSTFGLSEVLFGIIPAYVFPLLLERIPYKKARFLILCSKKMNAEEAYNLGIIDEIVEEDKLDKKIKDYIKRLLYSSPDALKLTKIYSDKLTDNKIDIAIDYAQKQLTELLNNKDNIKAIKSFIEGESPHWVVKYH